MSHSSDDVTHPCACKCLVPFQGPQGQSQAPHQDQDVLWIRDSFELSKSHFLSHICVTWSSLSLLELQDYYIKPYCYF